MIAAIYARKSTEQRAADAEAKSVERQIENARAFAADRRWTVADSHVYSDDAVSGADVRRLVQRQRLLDIIHRRPPFQVLIMRDSSRFSGPSARPSATTNSTLPTPMNPKTVRR